MYLDHFHLREMPFSITPGTAFAFASRAHQEALNTLLVAVQSGEGFVKITGEVGTGKTILCRRFLDVLQRQGVVTAYIPNPAMQPRALLRMLADELDVFGDVFGDASPTDDADEYTLIRNINKRLVGVAEGGGSVVVCLDEAQSMPRDTLEAVRLLSNLETGRSKLLQLVLFGQPELDQTLADTSLRQLLQRITFEYEMSSMSMRELDRYVSHRLCIAGHMGAELFSPAAIHRLHQATRGVPRLVNVLCHKALLSVFGEGGRCVLPRHVRAAAADTSAAHAPGYLPLWLMRPAFLAAGMTPWGHG